jgi:hypothetical protein
MAAEGKTFTFNWGKAASSPDSANVWFLELLKALQMNDTVRAGLLLSRDRDDSTAGKLIGKVVTALKNDVKSRLKKQGLMAKLKDEKERDRRLVGWIPDYELDESIEGYVGREQFAGVQRFEEPGGGHIGMSFPDGSWCSWEVAEDKWVRLADASWLPDPSAEYDTRAVLGLDYDFGTGKAAAAAAEQIPTPTPAAAAAEPSDPTPPEVSLEGEGLEDVTVLVCADCGRDLHDGPCVMDPVCLEAIEERRAIQLESPDVVLTERELKSRLDPEVLEQLEKLTKAHQSGPEF